MTYDKKKHNLEELRKLALVAKTVEDLYAIFYEMLEDDLPDEIIYEIINSIHFNDELKQEIEKEQIKK